MASISVTEQMRHDYHTLHRQAGVVVLPSRTRLQVTGKDRAAFLHNLCTNDIKRLTPGTGCETFVTNVQGKILGHLLVFCQPDTLLLDTVAGQSDTLLPHLDRYIITEDVQLQDLSQQLGWLLLAGPQAPEVCRRMGLDPVPAQLGQHADLELEQIPVQLARVPLLRGPALLLTVPAAGLADVKEQLQQAGAEICSDEALQIGRVEAGFPQYGQDISSGNLPQEVARDAAAISFTKGCYLGQETVARIDALGHVNWLLRGLRLDDVDPLPQPPEELVVDGKPVARITSLVHSLQLDAPLAMAYVRREYHDPGTQLPLPVGRAEVLQLPLSSPAS